MKDIKHVAVYLRLSRNEENLDIDEVFASHEKVLFKMCEDNNWKKVVFKEVASSVYLGRKQLNIMLDRIKEKEFDYVLVMDIDRLSRDVFDAPTIFKVLNDSKTNIITPSKIYDWEKDEDVLLLNIQMVVASQEYKQIKKRMSRGKRDASELGLWAHGIPPLGFDKDPVTRKLVPNENSKHIEYIFHSIVNGKTVTEVFTSLNAMGIKTRTGHKFHFHAIERIVNNEAYKGTLVYNQHMITGEKRKDGKNRTKKRPKEEWKRILNAHPAIIDETTWEKANKIVNTYSFSKKRSDVKTYPTSKLIYCANCNRLQGPQYYPHIDKLYLKVCKYCKNRTYLYKPILKMIKEDVLNYSTKILEKIEHIELTDNSSEIEYRKKQIQKQIEKCEKAIEKIKYAFEEDEYTISEFKERKASREEEIKHLKAELEEIQQQDTNDILLNYKEIKNRVDYLLQNWECIDGEGLSDTEVNRNLHFIYKKIEWKYDKGEDAVPQLTFEYK